LTTATGAPIASDNQQNSTLSHAIFAPFKSPKVRDTVLILLLLAINLYCFHRTISGYFLADDFVHVPYLVKVFNGHADLLLQNFYTNWVQAQGTQFYRPLISLTLALDYALWKANPTGYHITNFLYQTASTVFLFLCTRRIFSYRNTLEANSVGFLAGAFFAACPLHPEVVSWIIARVDSVQTTFLLASFWFYLRARDGGCKTSRALSYACFVVALLSKEMAITLPPTLVLLEMIKSDKSKLIERIKEAAKATWQYWLILAIYMGVRTAALGTISGGYAGSIGQGLSSSLFKRWFQDGSFGRVLLPLNAELPGGTAHKLVRSLKLMYELAAVLVFSRMALLYREGALSVYLRRLLFAAGWFVIAMLPTYQVWNLTETLQGSRFIYTGTAPLCLLAALLIAPLHFEIKCQGSKVVNFLSAMLALVMLWTCMQITYQNNSAWAQASKGVRAFRNAVELWFDRHEKDGAKLVVLNIPQKYAGAHMIYNAATLSVLLRPPLSSKDFSDRVVTFEPITFGSADLINASRLRRLMAESNRYHITRWDSTRQILVPLNLVKEPVNKQIQGSDNTDSRTAGNESFLVSPPIDVPAVSVDFVDIQTESDKKASPDDIIVMSWNTPSDPIFRESRTLAQAVENGKHNRFAVSEHKNWIGSEKIHQLKFDLPNGMTIGKLTLSSGENLIPTISPDLTAPEVAGRTVAEDVGGVSRPGTQIGPFIYDVSKVTGADHAVIEISNADSWFEHYSGTFRDTALSKEALISKSLNKKSGQFSLPAKELNRPGFYEIRVCAVDKAGKLCGFPSDPIDLQFSAEDIKK
jgi:protein O-mannosyl-transferase